MPRFPRFKDTKHARKLKVVTSVHLFSHVRARNTDKYVFLYKYVYVNYTKIFLHEKSM